MKSIIKIVLTAISLVAGVLQLQAQVTLEDIERDPRLSALNLCEYPVQKISGQTKAPGGFKPCYVYMYSRHGSRYLIEDEELLVPYGMLSAADSAGGLTDAGKRTLERLSVIIPQVSGRYGHLADVGRRQLYGIAGRMYDSYPSLFKGHAVIDAKSTDSPRVIFTMTAFGEEMVRRNPKITFNVSCDGHNPEEWGSPVAENKDYEETATPWLSKNKQYRNAIIDYDVIVSRIFTKEYLESHKLSSRSIIAKLMAAAANVQDMDVPFDKCSLYEIFTPEELYAYAVTNNYAMALGFGALPCSYGVESASFKQPARYLVERADDALNCNGPSATLRFCHDSQIGPWASALKLGGAYFDTMDVDEIHHAYNVGDVVPMAANIQFVFFKNRKGKVLVKILLNERETSIPLPNAEEGAPYYRWEDLKTYLLSY